MPVLIVEPLSMSDEQCAALESMARSSSLPHRQVVQALVACLFSFRSREDEVVFNTEERLADR